GRGGVRDRSAGIQCIDLHVIARARDPTRAPVAGRVPVTATGVDPGHGGRQRPVFQPFQTEPTHHLWACAPVVFAYRPPANRTKTKVPQQRVKPHFLSPFGSGPRTMGAQTARRADRTPGRCGSGEEVAWRRRLAGRLVPSRRGGWGLTRSMLRA